MSCFGGDSLFDADPLLPFTVVLVRIPFELNNTRKVKKRQHFNKIVS